MTSLEGANWSIELLWVKAHVAIVGNELADQLAKAAARDSDANDRLRQAPDEHTDQDDRRRNKTKIAKGMGRVYKGQNYKRVFFPTVHKSQQLKINITPILTAIVTGHRKTRAYLHRFKILEHETAPAGT